MMIYILLPLMSRQTIVACNFEELAGETVQFVNNLFAPF